jgi:hypothetical protein
VTLTVQNSTTIPIKILRSGAIREDAVVDLDLSVFTNDQGIVPPFTVSVPGQQPANHLEAVPFKQAVLAVDLHIPELPAAGKYTGRLLFTARDTASQTQSTPTVWRFILTSAEELRPANLIVSPAGALTLTAVRALLPSMGSLFGFNTAEEPSALLQLRDKTGVWPIDGVMLRVEQGLKSPGSDFDLRDHFRADFDSRKNVDLFSTPKPGERRIEAG